MPVKFSNTVDNPSVCCNILILLFPLQKYPAMMVAFIAILIPEDNEI